VEIAHTLRALLDEIRRLTELAVWCEDTAGDPCYYKDRCEQLEQELGLAWKSSRVNEGAAVKYRSEAAPTSEAICITCLSDPAKSRGIEYLPTLLETVTWEIGQTGDDRRGLAFATATRYHKWLAQWRKTQGYGPLSAPPWVEA
jgi:hypothetical protein